MEPFLLQTTVRERLGFGMKELVLLAKPGLWTLLESGFRNAIYLAVVARIVLLGAEYATAWGVFNTIRYGCKVLQIYAEGLYTACRYYIQMVGCFSIVRIPSH
jgi:hypothetical protein